MDASSTPPINLAGGNAGDMLARACALGPLLREHAQDNEKAGRLAPEVV
ncbi:MAG: hypothetical protein JWQ13_1432, partial [Ramlibacter sp.]|nr:hypothetical protein [Ramlibacter sp.]